MDTLCVSASLREGGTELARGRESAQPSPLHSPQTKRLSHSRAYSFSRLRRQLPRGGSLFVRTFFVGRQPRVARYDVTCDERLGLLPPRIVRNHNVATPLVRTFFVGAIHESPVVSHNHTAAAPRHRPTDLRHIVRIGFVGSIHESPADTRCVSASLSVASRNIKKQGRTRPCFIIKELLAQISLSVSKAPSTIFTCFILSGGTLTK